MCFRVVGVCFGLYIDVLSVSMRFRVTFCIYEHIKRYIFGFSVFFYVWYIEE